MSRLDQFRANRLGFSRLAHPSFRGAEPAEPPVITATTLPYLGALTDGDQVQDGLSAGALDTSNYASTAGTITDVSAAVTINGSPGALTDEVAFGDVVSVTVTVTDDAANERPFGAGLQTVQGIAPTITASDSLSGRTLTITVDSTTGVPAPDTTLTVLTLDGVSVPPASGPDPWTYEVPDSADSQTVAWTVDATNDAGSDTASGSEAVAANLFAPTANTAPEITGTAAPGETVTIVEGTYSGVPAPTVTGVLTLDGVDVTADMSGLDYTIPGDTPDGVTLDWSGVASNGVAPDATQSVSETVTDVQFPSATGGTTDDIIDPDNGFTYRVHTFTGSGTLNVTQGGDFEALLVGGGASGAGREQSRDNGQGGGGGGAGGFRLLNKTLSSASYSIIVGDGGASAGDEQQGRDGAPTIFDGDEAAGGGGGGRRRAIGGDGGRDGGSGGGAGGHDEMSVPGGFGNVPAVAPSQGNSGGGGESGNSSIGFGGGGAGETPSDGDGGNGVYVPWLDQIGAGDAGYFSGGGGGSAGGPGGLGGGGDGSGYGENDALPGAPNTGGGGGSSHFNQPTSGAGGSGFFAIRYRIA